LAKQIFLELTELRGEGQDTRRRVMASQLPLQTEDEDLIAVLGELTRKRLITAGLAETSPPADIAEGEETAETQKEGETTYEVAHEALIREWPQLRTWIKNNRENELTRRQLIDDAQEWLDKHKNPDFLYRKSRLVTIEGWQQTTNPQLNDETLEFLAKSQIAVLDEQEEKLRQATALAAEQKRVSQRDRMVLGIVSTITLTLLVYFVGIPYYMKLEAAKVQLAEVEINSQIVEFEAYEVTNERYFKCIDWGGQCNRPRNYRTIIADWDEKKALPVVNIDALDALYFCQWISRTLPTAEQWTSIAPPIKDWSNLPPSQAVLSRNQSDPQPISGNEREKPQWFINAEVNSENVIYDLVGNVEEWTRTIVRDELDIGSCEDVNEISSNQKVVLLGQSFGTPMLFVGNTYTNTVDTAFRATFLSETVGFRCVTSLEVQQFVPCSDLK
ncbi:MAG: SUMF1/EgtB/PvdO family nonheme iron enzyme, partial [Anaerolineales bacterium]|nr:SUMF1/EgtB/PvdO family nonheme iron enzyme [Anaerolineales bacterium]